MNGKSSLLMGIGIGLVISSLVITLFTFWKPDTATTGESSLQLNLDSAGVAADEQRYTSETSGPSEDQSKAPDNDSSKGQNNEQSVDQSKDQAYDAGDGSQKSDGQPHDSQSGSSGQGANAEFVAVTIPSGSTANEIAEILVDHHVIVDKAEFLDTVKKRRVSTKFQTGTFIIQTEQGVDALIDQLMAQPLEVK